MNCVIIIIIIYNFIIIKINLLENIDNYENKKPFSKL